MLTRWLFVVGHESGRAESCDSSSPVGSPFSSRAGTPISSPVPGSSSGVPGSRSLRKVLSRHSSRSLVMSRSQLERGTLLELCLSVLGCSAQWHLQLLANRFVKCFLFAHGLFLS